MSEQKNELESAKISNLIVCKICNVNDDNIVKTICIQGIDGKKVIYTNVDNGEIYDEGYSSLAESKDGQRTLEQGYKYSAVFKKYLAENNLTEEDSVLLSTLKEQVIEMNKNENHKQEEREF